MKSLNRDLALVGQMATYPLSVTTEERILLYLSDFKGMEERFEVPEALTQESIARAAAIQRKHVSRYLDDLVREALMVERKAHVEGRRQRMFVYHLTPQGWRRSQTIKEYLRGLRLPVRVRGEIKQMTMEEIDKATSVRVTFVDLVREATTSDVIDLSELERIDERRKRDMGARLRKLEEYTKALMTAWRDGRVTATERLLMEQLRQHLGITEAEHERIESDVVESLTGEKERSIAIYRNVYRDALRRGGIAQNEREMLGVLRDSLGLIEEDQSAIEGSEL